MSTARSVEYQIGLVRELCHLIGEVEWVEFKRSKVDPQEIGEYISALASAAALNGKVYAYVLWGVDEAVEDSKIVIEDPTAGTRSRTYLPFWASQSAQKSTRFV